VLLLIEVAVFTVCCLVLLNIRSMQQMLDYDGDDFQDVFGIAFEVQEHFVYE